MNLPVDIGVTAASTVIWLGSELLARKFASPEERLRLRIRVVEQPVDGGMVLAGTLRAHPRDSEHECNVQARE